MLIKILHLNPTFWMLPSISPLCEGLCARRLFQAAATVARLCRCASARLSVRMADSASDSCVSGSILLRSLQTTLVFIADREHFFKQLNTASVSLQVLCYFFQYFLCCRWMDFIVLQFWQRVFFSKDKDGFTAPLRRRYTQQGII